MLRPLVRGAVEHALLRLPSRVEPGSRLVLAYHNVVPASWRGSGDRSLHLPVNAFIQQLEVLQRTADVVPLMDLLGAPSSARPRVAITFDDAYASALELGVSACVSRGLPCTVFVAPALLGTVPVWDHRAAAGRWSDEDRREFLTTEQGRGAVPSETTDDAVLQIASLDAIASGSEGWGGTVTFGNHTTTHPNLSALPTAEVREEIATCDQWLREHVAAQRIPVIAYPYGHAPVQPEAAVPTDVATHGLLVSGGWMRASTTYPPLAVPRWNVPAGISLNGFRVRLRGRLLGG